MYNFQRINCVREELCLRTTLTGGQSFRWKQFGNDWLGVFCNRVWRINQNDTHLFYVCYPNDLKENAEDLIKSYFRLNVNLTTHYKTWAERDPYFKECAEKFLGVRILKQDLIENLFAFICSSNNNIQRITLMIEKLCQKYGKLIGKVDDNDYYSFPTVESLADSSVEESLREMGFGYRAKFIHNTACSIVDEGVAAWNARLTALPYDEAKQELMKLAGVGAKVADCICLMSLGHLQAVPVDTHVFQIAQTIYLPHLKEKKSVTDKVYLEVANHFRELYGDFAGWAHTILFCADLQKFKRQDNKNNHSKHRKKSRKK